MKKHVKIVLERGYGSEMFQVCKEAGNEFTLKDKTGKRFNIYKKHCYQDHECLFANKSMKR